MILKIDEFTISKIITFLVKKSFSDCKLLIIKSIFNNLFCNKNLLILHKTPNIVCQTILKL